MNLKDQYLQHPAVLLAGAQRPLQLGYLLLQAPGLGPVVTERARHFVELLSQLALVLLGSAQRRGQPLLPDLQSRTPVLAVSQQGPQLRQPLLQRSRLGLQLGCPELGPLQLALQGALGELQAARSALCCFQTLLQLLFVCICSGL